jgi:hypothetical protein
MKNEYQYLACVLIFGFKGTKTKEYSIFSSDVFKNNKNLEVKENSHLSPENNRLETVRQLTISSIELRASHINAAEISQILTFCNTKYGISLSDTIFSDSEFELVEYDWEKMIYTRINKLALLIKALNSKEINDLPLIINEFPNITGVLFKNMEYWR